MEKEETGKKQNSDICKCGSTAIKKFRAECPPSPICLHVAISIEICHIDSKGRHQLSRVEFAQ